MRKHFLILMLLTLLPLAGFALESINLSTAENVVITLNRTQLDYTGRATAPVVTALSVGGVDKTELLESEVTVTFYKKSSSTYTAIAANLVRDAGDYALTLKGDGDPFTTDESAKVDFTINPGELSITLKNATKVYGDPDPSVIEYDWDNMSQLRGDDDVNNVIITLNLSATSRAAGEDVNTEAGYAYNTITATTANYNVKVNGHPVLFITKRPLTGTYTGTVEKVYGEEDPAFDKTKLTFTNWAARDNTDAKKAAALTIAANAALSYQGTDANYSADGSTVITGKALYPITITGVTSTNYALTLPAIGMKIKQKLITDDDVAITAQNAETTYNAAKSLLPSDKYSVIYKGTSATFDVKYYSNAERTTEVAEANVKNAAKYYYQIEGKGNFAGTFNGVNAQNTNGLVWEIKQKDLYVYALTDTKVYDATEWGTDEVSFQYNGLEGDDAVTTDATATIGTTAVHNSANVNEEGYVVTPTTTGVAIKNGDEVVTANYKIQGLTYGKLKITKRPLKLKAGNQTLDLGYTNAQLTAALAVASNVTIEPASGTGAALRGAVAAEVDAYDNNENAGIKDVITSALDAALATTNSWDYANAGSYPKAITITWDTENVPAVLKNYDIKVEAGDFTVNGGTFSMIAMNENIKYGDPVPTFSYLTSDNVAIKKGATVTFKVYKDGVEEPNPTEVGTYTIKIDEKTEDYLPANFTGIKYVPGTLTIKERPLTVVVADQTLSKDQAATALLQGDKYVTVTGMVKNEKVKLNIVAVDGVFSTAAVTEEPIPGAITVEMPASAVGYNNGNYTITGPDASITMGKLTVIPAATIVLNRPLRDAYKANPALDNAADVIAAADAEKYDEAGAAAYNAGLQGAISTSMVKTPGQAAVPYTRAEAKEANAENANVIYNYDHVVTADEVEALNGLLTPTTVNENDVLTDVQVEELNHGVEGFIATGAVKTPAVAPVYYTENEAKTHNAALPGAVAAGNTQKKNVTFGDFTMYAEKWYAMVLPFNTTVAEVSREFGYAIVDLLNTDNNKNAVSFKLHMQEIAANTPFIIKVYKEMDMNKVVFENKTVVNPAAADLVQTDKFGNTFTGTYSAKNGTWIAGQDAWKKYQDYLFSVAETNNTYGHAVNGETAAATSYLNPVCAYITYKNAQSANNNAPIIYIEEADGSTTAISSITADGEMIPTQGWYTINGMKLETVPTQKGIYINNGKKVVIK